MTVVFLGRTGSGKSSIIDSILSETIEENKIWGYNEVYQFVETSILKSW